MCDAVNWILADRLLQGADKAIMFALASRANWKQGQGDDICRPSLDTLAADAGVSRPTVACRLPALQRAGYIHIFRHARGNRYHLQTPGAFWCATRCELYGDGPCPALVAPAGDKGRRPEKVRHAPTGELEKVRHAPTGGELEKVRHAPTGGRVGAPRPRVGAPRTPNHNNQIDSLIQERGPITDPVDKVRGAPTSADSWKDWRQRRATP